MKLVSRREGYIQTKYDTASENKLILEYITKISNGEVWARVNSACQQLNFQYSNRGYSQAGIMLVKFVTKQR
jgi:hypothetical protein